MKETEEVYMKQCLVKRLVLGIFMVLLTGMIGLANAGFFFNPTNPGRKGPPGSVPEPATLALVGAGIVGVGVYFYVKKKRK